jgi:hypothetical protein
MSRRHAARLAAALAAGLLLAAGCGGGGGGGDESADAQAPVAAVGPATGVEAVATDTLFGTPEAVSDARTAGTLGGYDEFGTPRDGFVQIVREDDGGGGTNEAVSGATPSSTPTDPISVGSGPVVAVPAGSAPAGVDAGGTGTAPAATPTPSEAPAVSRMEADFDIGGEPVVAHQGDAIPPGTQQFTVTGITASRVVLTLNGGLLPDGSDTVTLDEGESITLYNQTARTTYKVRLLDIRRV